MVVVAVKDAEPASQTVVVVFVIPPCPERPVALITVAVVVEIGEAVALTPVGNVTLDVVFLMLPPFKDAEDSADIGVPAVRATAPASACIPVATGMVASDVVRTPPVMLTPFGCVIVSVVFDR